MLTCMLVSLWLCRCREKLKSHNAKLVYDVMKFDEKFCCIVLFCVGTAVVCEKSETADLLASTADYRFRVAIPFNNSVLKLYVSVYGNRSIVFTSTKMERKCVCSYTHYSLQGSWE